MIPPRSRHKPLAILGESTLENNESTESSWSMRISILAVLRGLCLVYFAIGKFQAEGDPFEKKSSYPTCKLVEPLSESPGHFATDKPWNFPHISPPMLLTDPFLDWPWHPTLDAGPTI